MKSYCNPLDLEYRFMRAGRGQLAPCGEGTDPGTAFWHGKYWLVTSKGAGGH